MIDSLAEFLLKVNGNEMAPTFQDGDIVLCVSTDIIPDGGIAVIEAAGLAGSVTLKYCYRTPGGYVLDSEACTQPPLFVAFDTIKPLGLPVLIERTSADGSMRILPVSAN